MCIMCICVCDRVCIIYVCVCGVILYLCVCVCVYGVINTVSVSVHL